MQVSAWSSPLVWVRAGPFPPALKETGFPPCVPVVHDGWTALFVNQMLGLFTGEMLACVIDWSVGAKPPALYAWLPLARPMTVGGAACSVYCCEEVALFPKPASQAMAVTVTWPVVMSVTVPLMETRVDEL